MKILVTGGAGYIGSHCILALLNKGFEVVVYDNLSTGHIEIIDRLKKCGDFEFYKGDLSDIDTLDAVFKKSKPDAVMHFAAFSQVAESVENPQKYYRNNVVGTLKLLDTMLKNEVKLIVFSSTAAVYGEPQYIPIDENHPKNPLNPYGQTKLVIEKIMDDYDKASGLKSVRLRYFNVIGADKNLITGEWHDNETHLVPKILEFVNKPGKTFSIFGNNYNTKDGTCVRDYINVEDLADAHIKALEYLNNSGVTDCFNHGTNEGYTVKEIFDAVSETINYRIPYEYEQRRSGDSAVLVADNSKAKKVLNWSPQKKLKYSIKTAWQWEKELENISRS